MDDSARRVRLKQEVDGNYDFLQRNLANLLPDHQGEYVLLKSRAVVEFFGEPGDAYRAAIARFPDRIFSIQEVSDEPLDLGFLSYAGA